MTLHGFASLDTLGSGTIDVAMQDPSHNILSYTATPIPGEDVHSRIIHMFSDSSHSTSVAALQQQPGFISDVISQEDCDALLNTLWISLMRPETLDGISGKWDGIRQALLRNPIMMRNLRRLQLMGAELVVTDFEEGRFVKFADAADSLDILKQEDALAALTQAEREDAIERILTSVKREQHGEVSRWILGQLNRPADAEGLIWTEALVLAVAHGGTLISTELYLRMAKADPGVSEDDSWTWTLKSLGDVIQSKHAPSATRSNGRIHEANLNANLYRFPPGMRAAELEVSLAN